MSLKYAAQKVGDAHYVLPKTKQMKVDVDVFLSEELYSASEEKTWEQLMNAASYEGVKSVYCMPDCHAGYGVPIGCVLVTDDVIVQSAAGYDISCGVAALKVKGARAGAVKSKYDRRRWITEIEERIALGVGNHRPKLMPVYTDQLLEEVFRHGAQPLGVDASVCEREFLPVSDRFDSKMIEKARRNALEQLGSLGGGNHYLELDCDPADGSLWIFLHTGSRGYGWQTAEYFFKEGALLRGIPLGHRESSWVRTSEELGKKYWDYHNSAGNYASANRHAIALAVKEATQEVFNADCETYYEISHNLVQLEPSGYVHRKGATRAFPVGSGLRGEGHPILTPGSMYEGAAISRALPGAAKSGYSVNHGSGRVMGRNEAKKKLGHKQQRIDDEMDHVFRTFGGVQIEGVMINSRHVPLDECGEVYKSLDEVLYTLKTEGIVNVEHRLYPIACVKGND